LPHDNHTRLGVLSIRADGDLDPLTQGGQEPEETVQGVAFDAATDE